MEPSVEVAIVIFFVVAFHFLIFYFLTRKKKNIDGRKYYVFIEIASLIESYFQGKHVVVTGGSSGIGLWVAIYAARMGADVTIVARKVAILGKHTIHTQS